MKVKKDFKLIFFRYQNSILNKSRVHSWMNATQVHSKNNRTMSSLTAKYEWKIVDIFRGAFSAVILNTPIVNPKFATSIWRRGKPFSK